MKWLRSFIIGLIICMLWFNSSRSVGAQETSENRETYEAKIVRILEDKEIELEKTKQPYQKLELQITKGADKDKKVLIENGNLPLAHVVRYKMGDRLLIGKSVDLDGSIRFEIIDAIRLDSLTLLFIIFMVLTLLVAKRNGAGSLLSLVLTFLIIFKFTLPQLLDGKDPVFVAVLSSAFIIPLTFYISHGFNKKTSVAIGGTLLSLVVTGVLAKLFIELSSLYGFSSEESGLLAGLRRGSIDMKGLLLAGIVIGSLGVLDDITVAQASIVEQLRQSSPKGKFKEIYARAMKVGQDHITSMVNTLILVYAGASLPLLLIFVDNPHPFGEIVNYEFIAEEIVRTLVGSIGLILAVPVTTLLATSIFTKPKKMLNTGTTEATET